MCSSDEKREIITSKYHKDVTNLTQSLENSCKNISKDQKQTKHNRKLSQIEIQLCTCTMYRERGLQSRAYVAIAPLRTTHIHRIFTNKKRRFIHFISFLKVNKSTLSNPGGFPTRKTVWHCNKRCKVPIATVLTAWISCLSSGCQGLRNDKYMGVRNSTSELQRWRGLQLSDWN